MGVGWSLQRNDCKNCEPGDGCGTHHQSPVPLDRQWGARKRMGDTGVMNCGDNHWMKYEGGTCNWEHLRAANAVTVERHALRISQPVVKEDNSYELDCYVPGRGRIFSRMDMSGGFSQWWFLNHIDIHTPSEHTQNGKRYAVRSSDIGITSYKIYDLPINVFVRTFSGRSSFGLLLLGTLWRR